MALKELKLNKNLSDESLSLSKQLSADNINRTISYVSLVVLVLVAFFISLANAEFNFRRILEAQFWIDFSFTTGGGLFLKWIFGKWGSVEGHRHPNVKKALTEIEEDNKKIEDKKLVSVLNSYVIFNNMVRKIKAIRKKVYHKLQKSPRSKKWQKYKLCVKYAEELLSVEDGSDRYKELKTKLEDLNFDLEGFKIKYNSIKKSTLKTGFSSTDEADEKMSYSETWQLFGRSSIITLATFLLSILLAIVSPEMVDRITLATVFVFVSRVAVYVMNAYVGFTIAKSSVERVKLNVLVSIHKFLALFIEINTGV